jgi:hypothetical protein
MDTALKKIYVGRNCLEGLILECAKMLAGISSVVRVWWGGAVVCSGGQMVWR